MNGLIFVYGSIPWVAPVLVAFGYIRLGRILFLLYTPLCHQRPEQSFFLLGHQVAFCHREAAMYTSLFIGGLVFALVRDKIRPIRFRTVGLLLLPMAVDGATHIINELIPAVVLRSTNHDIGSFNWWARMITGVLFTLAIVFGVYPRVDRELRGQIDQSMPSTPQQA